MYRGGGEEGGDYRETINTAVQCTRREPDDVKADGRETRQGRRNAPIQERTEREMLDRRRTQETFSKEFVKTTVARHLNNSWSLL